MKIGGVEIKGPNEEILVLPRGESNIVITARAVMDMDSFDKLCPEPQAPGRLMKGVWVPNPDDKDYKALMDIYQANRLAYLMIKSLEPSNIEWDTVDINNPGTWPNYLADLKNGGLSNIEINRIIACVMQANSLDEKKLEEARKSFLLGQGRALDTSSGLNTALQNTLSGGLANG